MFRGCVSLPEDIHGVCWKTPAYVHEPQKSARHHIWWFQPTPLKNLKVSWDLFIPNLWEKICTCSKPSEISSWIHPLGLRNGPHIKIKVSEDGGGRHSLILAGQTRTSPGWTDGDGIQKWLYHGCTSYFSWESNMVFKGWFVSRTWTWNFNFIV